MIRHIFSDMDGTLLDLSGQVSPTTVQALRDTGLPITLVSARAPMEMAPAIEALALTEPQIGYNGGLIYRRTDTGWEYLDEEPIPHEAAMQLVNFFAAQDPAVSVSYYGRAAWYAPRLDAGVNFQSSLTHLTPILADPAELLAQDADPFFKIMLISFDEPALARVADALTELAVPGITIQRSSGAYVEITSAAAKKSRGIDYIFEREQLKKEETAAFGDGHNDLPMFARVGLPVVMANAPDDVKEVAAYVTRSHTEDGIAYALAHHPAFRSRE